ncbi:MAG: NAD(P)-dependent oxidoreductase [Candidatus Latescibacteria bacterium]|nr:NAD(P)-dependent oxidoreductase [Candidatus Latescibacterota bacterium]
MPKRKLLITGGSGYLGRHLTAKAVERFEVCATYHRHAGRIRAGQPIPLDLTNREDVFRVIAGAKPHAVIHTAAINPGDGTDARMWSVNVEGSRSVAEASASVGARLVHVSSDSVHNGRHAPYPDEVAPSPINGYGRSKAAAEAAVIEAYPGAAIVRTSLIYGLTAEMDRGTAGFVERIEAGEMLTLFDDVIRQPIWVESLSEALLSLATLDFAGTLNVAGRQAMSREEFGRKMLDRWNVDLRGLVRSGRAAELSDAIPLDLRLSVDKAEALLNMVFPGVDDVINNVQ